MQPPHTFNTVERAAREHPAFEAWTQLEPQSVEPDVVVTLQVRNKSEVYRLTDVGHRGTSLIAKRCKTVTAKIEQTIYEQLLPRLPLPALHYYGSVADGRTGYTWMFLEEAGPGEYTPFCDDHRVLSAQWLGTMHGVAGANGFSSSLSPRGADYYLRELHTSRAKIQLLSANPVLPPEDLRVTETMCAQLDTVEAHWSALEEMCAGCPATVVHGDFVIKNVRVREHEGQNALFVFDWELAGWGVPATDLTQFTGRTVSPDLEIYCAAAAQFNRRLTVPDAERLAACGRFFRLLDDIAWACEWLGPDAYVFIQQPIGCLRSYAVRLDDALRAARWT